MLSTQVAPQQKIALGGQEYRALQQALKLLRSEGFISATFKLNQKKTSLQQAFERAVAGLPFVPAWLIWQCREDRFSWQRQQAIEAATKRVRDYCNLRMLCDHHQWALRFENGGFLVEGVWLSGFDAGTEAYLLERIQPQVPTFQPGDRVMTPSGEAGVVVGRWMGKLRTRVYRYDASGQLVGASTYQYAPNELKPAATPQPAIA